MDSLIDKLIDLLAKSEAPDFVLSGEQRAQVEATEAWIRHIADSASTLTPEEINALNIGLSVTLTFAEETSDAIQFSLLKLLKLVSASSESITVLSPCVALLLQSLAAVVDTAALTPAIAADQLRQVTEYIHPLMMAKEEQPTHLDEPWIATGLAIYLWRIFTSPNTIEGPNPLEASVQAAPMLKYICDLIPKCIDTSGTATIPIRVLWLVFHYCSTLLKHFDGVTFFNTPVVPPTQLTQALSAPEAHPQPTPKTPLRICWEAIEPAIHSIERLHSSVRGDIKETTFFLGALNQVASGITPKPAQKPEKLKEYEDAAVQELVDVCAKGADDCLESLYTLIEKRRVWLQEHFEEPISSPLTALFWMCIVSGDKSTIRRLLCVLPREVVELNVMPAKDRFDAASQAIHKLVRRERNLELLRYLLDESDSELDTRTGQVGLNNIARSFISTVQTADPGMAPIHIASIRNCPGIVRLLVAAGVNLEQTDENQKTGLYWACACTCYNSAEALIQLGANPNVCDTTGFSPLHRSAILPDSRFVSLLLEHGANPRLLTQSSKATPLHRALFKGIVENAKILLKYTTDLNEVDGDGDSFLRLAALANTEEMLEQLIQLKVGVNLQNARGLTALHAAKTRRAVDLLVAAGADMEKTTFNIKETPIISAAGDGRFEVVQALLDHGANIEARTVKESTSLCVAAMWGHTAIVKYLLSKGANINACNEKGYAAVHWAIKQSNEEIFNILIDHPDLDPRSTTEHQLNSLHLICSLQTSPVGSFAGAFSASPDEPLPAHLLHRSLVQLKSNKMVDLLAVRKRMIEKLVARGVPVNGKTQQRRLPIHFCIERLGAEHVQALLAGGSEIDSVALGKTPLLIAVATRKEDIALELLARGANPKFSSSLGSVLSISASNNLVKVIDAILLMNTSDFVLFTPDEVGTMGLLKALEFQHFHLALKLANYLKFLTANRHSRPEMLFRILQKSSVIEKFELLEVGAPPAAPPSSDPSGLQPPALLPESVLYSVMELLAQVVGLNKPRLTSIRATLTEKVAVLPDAPLSALLAKLSDNYSIVDLQIGYQDPVRFYTNLMGVHSPFIMNCLYRNKKMKETPSQTGLYLSLLSFLGSAVDSGDYAISSRTSQRRVHSLVVQARFPRALLAHCQPNLCTTELSEKALSTLVWFLYSDELCTNVTVAPQLQQTFFGTPRVWADNTAKLPVLVELYQFGAKYDWANLLVAIGGLISSELAELRQSLPQQFGPPSDSIVSAMVENPGHELHQFVVPTLGSQLGDLFESCQEPSVASLAAPDFVIEALEDGPETESGDSQVVELRVHSRFLAHRWPWFRKLLTSGFKEATAGRLNLRSAATDMGLTADILRLILGYCYRGDLTLLTELCEASKGQPVANPFEHFIDYFGYRDSKEDQLTHLALISLWSGIRSPQEGK